MGSRRWPDSVYTDVHGVWWARAAGQRKTPNTRRAAEMILREMQVLQQFPEREDWIEDLGSRGPGAELIILRGVPGCGKTTWALRYLEKFKRCKRVSRDDLRAMVDGGRYSPANEKIIRKLRDRTIRLLLEECSSVIVDDTNLTRETVWELKETAEVPFIAGKAPIPARVLDFVTPLEECIRRDSLRAKPVGEERILEMYSMLCANKDYLANIAPEL